MFSDLGHGLEWGQVMREPVRLLFVHQNCLFRQLLVQAFSRNNRFSASDLDHVRPDIIEQMLAIKPALLLLDLGLPQGQAVKLTSDVRLHLPDTRVIALVRGAKLTEQTEAALFDCVDAGADGFVLEESSMDDLRRAIDFVMTGQRFYSQPIVESMFDQLTIFCRESRSKSQLANARLTQRELEVLRWIADGLSNKQIARKLCVSLYTVKSHVHNILEKLQVSDRYRAVDHAIDNRWFGAVADVLRVAESSDLSERSDEVLRQG
jgi:two-component system NarL family response regulator